jgi:hypothetical protein
VTRVDKLVDAGFRELDEQVAVGAVGGSEELASDSQAREAHHGGAGDVGSAQEGLGEIPEHLLAWFGSGFGGCHGFVSSSGVGTRRSAKGSGPRGVPSAVARSRSR